MNLFLIDKNENVIGVVPDGNIIDLTQSIEINQADVLNGTITLDKSLRLDEVRYFAVPDRDNPHNLWMYRKTVVKVENDDIIIQGVNAFYDDLKAYGYIKDKRPNSINAEQAVRLIIGNTRWNVDFVDASLNSSNAEIHGINFYYLTYLDAIKAIEDTWTIEIQPFINIEGNKITRKYINLYQQMGGNKGKRFVYGENALQIVKESNDTDVYTALIGRGAGVAEQDDQGNDTGGFSRKITFADVEWSKAKGDPVDKPLGQEWVEWPQATKKFGYSDGTPRFGIVEFQNEEDPTNLLKETWDNLKKSAIPSVQFSATVGNVGFLSLGETVAIVRYDLDIKYQTRVTKIDWNRKNEKASQITLGDKLVQSAADRYRSVQAEAYKARDIADQAAGQANFAIDNGGTTIQWGSNEPAHPKEGDLWYDKQPDGTVVMKQYVNGQWIILIDDTTGEQIKNKVDKAEENVKQLKTDADIAQGEFNKKLATNDDKLAHFSDELTVTDKKVDGLQGQITEVDNKATDIKNTADSAATIANDAMSRIQQAVVNASSDAAKIRSDVAKVQDEINTAKTANSTSVEALKSDIAVTKKDLAGVHDSLDQAQADIEQKQKQINDSVTKISNDIEQNRKDLAATQQANADTVEKLDSYTNQAIEQGKTIKELQTDDDSTKLTIADIKGNVIRVQDSVNGLTANLKDANDNLTTVKALADSLSATLTDNGKNIASLQATAKELSSTLGDAGGRLSKVEQTAEEQSTTLSTVQGDLSQVKQTADSLVTTLKDAQGNIDQLQQTSKGTAEQISSVQGDITSLQKDVSGIKATITDHDNNIHTLQADSKTLKDDMTDAQGDISSLQKTATSLDSEFKDHDGRISKVEQTANTLTNEFSDEQGHLNRVEQTANGTKQTVADHTGSIATLQSDANTLTSQMSSAQGDISTLKQTASGFSSKVIGMETSLANANSKINDITSNGGGRNLWLNSKSFANIGVNVPKVDWNTDSDGIATAHITGTGGFYSLWQVIYANNTDPFTIGDSETFSVEMKGTGTITIARENDFGKSIVLNGNDWARYSVSGTVKNIKRAHIMYNESGKDCDVYVRLPMVEKGTVAHDWQLAPEDTDAKITANTTAIEQNKNAITLKADQSTVDNLSGEVSKNKAQLKVQAGQISSKVSSEDFKTLDNKVGGAIAQIDKNATAIDQTNKDISLKADQTEVDNVKGTASQNSSQIQLMANEIKSKVTSTDVDNIVNSKGYATTNTVQSLVTQKAGTINESITNLEGKFNSSSSVNLAEKTNQGTTNWWVDPGNGTTTISEVNINGVHGVRFTQTRKSTSWWVINYQLNLDYFEPNQDYVISFDIRTSSDSFNQDGLLNISRSDSSHSYLYDTNFKTNFKQNQLTHVSCTGHSNGSLDKNGEAFYLYCSGLRQCDWVDIVNFKIARGTIDKGYSPAPSDNATVTQLQSVTASIDGIKSTVANKADQSTVTQLSNVIQSKVSNDDYQSKITELANGINSTVKKTDFDNLSKTVELQTLDSADINNMRTNGHYFVHNLANNPIFGWVYVDVVGNNNDRIRQDIYRDQDNQHFYRRWDGWQWTEWSKGATETQITQLSDSINTKVSNADYQSKITELADAIQSKVSSSNFDNLSKTVELQTLDSADINNMRTNGHYFVHNLANNPIFGWVYVDVVGNNNDRIRQDIYRDQDNQHFYRRWDGWQWTEWSKGATESEINQLSDNINLRVQKNDVINQINISPEGILIDGSRTHITGKTVIDNAAIRDAAISNLSASKLTAGVINCREIDVMNISGYQILANQITADKMAANAIMVGLNNSLTNLSINPYGFNITENGQNVLVFNKTGMRVSDPENNEQIGWIHANHMNDAHWFNGLALDVDALGDYVGFGSHNSSTNFYDVKFAYYKNKYQSHEADTLVSSVPFEFNNGELRHGGATLEFRNSWLEGKWNLPTLGRGPSYIMFGDTDVFVVINKNRYSMYDIIHSIGRGKTWN